jgi:hypothetical protein
MNIKTKIALASVSALGIFGAGASAVMAQTTSTPSPTVVTQPPSVTGTSDVETPASSETAIEAPGKEDPAEANLPGGGHADAPGSADHQFDGVE